MTKEIIKWALRVKSYYRLAKFREKGGHYWTSLLCRKTVASWAGHENIPRGYVHIMILNEHFLLLTKFKATLLPLQNINNQASELKFEV